MWNPWIFGGMPYWLDPQNFLWYPPNYLLLFLPLELGFLILLVGHLMFAGWVVKKILGNLGSLGYLGGLLFVLSPKMMAHLEEGNWSLIIANCWLPALYWALKNKRKWWVVISLSVIIINNLNIGYYAALFTVLFSLFRKRRGEIKQILGIMAAAGALTAPRWLPLVLFGSQTVRANLADPVLPFWSWTKIIKSLFFPLSGGHPQLQNEEILYIGIISGAIGLISLIWLIRKKNKESVFWTVWLGFILLVAVNIKTPFFFLIKLLPGFSLLRITTRPWIFVSLAAALAVPAALKKIGEMGKIGGIRVNGKVAKILTLALAVLVLADFGGFDLKIFKRREVKVDNLPESIYREIIKEGIPVRAYCTTGCLNRLKAQRTGIALLGGNNPIQLTEFVNYLQKAGGYRENSYYPILPPYTVFNEQSQPNAELLGQTATKFVISPYKLSDQDFRLIINESGYYLYKNMGDMAEYKDHYFNLKMN